MTTIPADKLLKDVKKMILQIGELDEDAVTPDAKFVEDLGLDSMMALEVLASLEKKYKVKIPEENLAKMTSLSKTVEVLTEHLT